MDIFILLFKCLMSSAILISFFSDPESITISWSFGFFSSSSSELVEIYFDQVVPLVVDKYTEMDIGSVLLDYSVNSVDSDVFVYHSSNGWLIEITPDWEGSADIVVFDSRGNRYDHIAIRQNNSSKFILD